MAKSKKKRRNPIPEEFSTLEEAAAFWDTHSLADYEDLLHDVEFTVAEHPKREYVIVLSEELDAALRETEQKEGLSPEALVNLWVQEKLHQCLAKNSTFQR